MKNRLTGLFSLALCTLVLTGCLSYSKLTAPFRSPAKIPAVIPASHLEPPGPARKRFYDSLKSWKGATLSELLASWGEPFEILEGYVYTYTRPVSLAKTYESIDPKAPDRPCIVFLVVENNIISRVFTETWFNCTETEPFPSRPKP